MRKLYGLLLLMLICCGAVFHAENVSAYYKDNCYAAQWEKKVNVKGDFTQTRVYSSKTLCYKNGKLESGARPNRTDPLSLPKFSNISGDSVTMKYCKKSLLGVCTSSETTTFKLSDYDNNFNTMAKAMDDLLAGLPSQSGYTKVAFETNASYTMETSGAEGQGDSDGDGVGSVTETCANQGGAQSLGWIVCPIMTWLGNGSSMLYNDYVEPALQVDPKLFSDEGGAVEGWSTFQNIANVIFVILLLIVIFSQLTGVGIDNYGIKKILPKLIISAILINLSYLICLIAVDISNILGNAFQALFNGLSEGLTPESINVDGSVIDTSSATGQLASVAVLGSAVIAGGAMWSNPAIVLSLLVSAVGVLISIFFLFIILATREAAILVLTVISPVAIVCYMLPNTKKLFDKWLDAFKALLLVYPICGLLVGGGNYVSRLMLTSGFSGAGFISAFTAMIAGIVPVFFIPTVLKNSMSALGNIGSRIAGIGQSVRGRATGSIRNSNAYQNAQESGRMRQTRIRAGIDSDGNVKKMGRFGTMVRGGKRNVARSRSQYLRDQEFANQVDSLNGVGMEAALIGQQKRSEAADLSNYMTLINNETRNGENESRLFGMFDEYMATGNKTGAVAVARIAGRRKDTAANFAQNKLTNAGMDAGSRYDNNMLQSVAKEMATGENSGNYRAASPLAFEFASQINKAGVDESGRVQADTNYSHWASQSANVGEALDHHVTNSSELVGMKNSSLDEIAGMMERGELDDATTARMQKLATETIENRGQTGVWDTTKEKNIYRIAGVRATGSGATVRPAVEERDSGLVITHGIK